MKSERSLLALVATVCFVLLVAGPALAWSNGPAGGDSFGTHDWVVHEANRLAVSQGYHCVHAGWAQTASDDPATVVLDAYYHVFDTRGPPTARLPPRWLPSTRWP